MHEPKKPNELSMPVISSNRFTWSRNDEGEWEGTAVASDIASIAEAEKLLFAKIYNDVADEGMAIRSERTGAVARFVVKEFDRSWEGDLKAIIYSPLDSHCPASKITVYWD